MSFEKWWTDAVHAPEMTGVSQRDMAEHSWNAAISEMSQPQDPSTCKDGHPRWALVKRDKDWPQSNWPSMHDEMCSICAAVEAERKRVETHGA